MQSIQKAEAVDDVTLTLTFSEAVQDIGYRLGQLYVLPQHIWEPLVAQQTSLKDIANDLPIGSGPWKVRGLQEGRTGAFRGECILLEEPAQDQGDDLAIFRRPGRTPAGLDHRQIGDDQ